MNLKDYVILKNKAKKMTPIELSEALFMQTGQINYYLLKEAIAGREKDKEWTNLESPEL